VFGDRHMFGDGRFYIKTCKMQLQRFCFFKCSKKFEYSPIDLSNIQLRHFSALLLLPFSLSRAATLPHHLASAFALLLQSQATVSHFSALLLLAFSLDLHCATLVRFYCSFSLSLSLATLQTKRKTLWCSLRERERERERDLHTYTEEQRWRRRPSHGRRSMRNPRGPPAGPAPAPSPRTRSVWLECVRQRNLMVSWRFVSLLSVCLSVRTPPPPGEPIVSNLKLRVSGAGVFLCDMYLCDGCDGPRGLFCYYFL
jgi:hypothetical protein